MSAKGKRPQKGELSQEKTMELVLKSNSYIRPPIFTENGWVVYYYLPKNNKWAKTVATTEKNAFKEYDRQKRKIDRQLGLAPAPRKGR